MCLSVFETEKLEEESILGHRCRYFSIFRIFFSSCGSYEVLGQVLRTYNVVVISMDCASWISYRRHSSPDLVGFGLRFPDWLRQLSVELPNMSLFLSLQAIRENLFHWSYKKLLVGPTILRRETNLLLCLLVYVRCLWKLSCVTTNRDVHGRYLEGLGVNPNQQGNGTILWWVWAMKRGQIKMLGIWLG